MNMDAELSFDSLKNQRTHNIDAINGEYSVR